jgi:pyruvate kinase
MSTEDEQAKPAKLPNDPASTKIVCTIGPSSESSETLEKLIQAGMDVCRLNFSHGAHEKHKETFDRIRELSVKWNHQVAILCDIQGPKIRTGKMQEPFSIQKGDMIRVTPDKTVVGNKDRISISYENMLQDLNTDDVIFINDGIIKLVVEAKDEAANDLICKCHAAGFISDHKGVNMPSGKLSVNVVTPKDDKDLEFIASLNPEFVAASFCGFAEDVEKVRDTLAKYGNTEIKICAKIERPVALENLDAIIKASDALMVARGDLGVEIEAWEVPKWQKDMVARCNRESKPVIVATQMLESMCENSRPTRAEASDVYNAVIDGADAVMLSGESSVGAYPVEAVSVMNSIVREAQVHMPKRDSSSFVSTSAQNSITEGVCHASCTIALEFLTHSWKGKIIVYTETGRAARHISKYRPTLPILAFSSSVRTVRELALVWGVRAHWMRDIGRLGLEQKAMKCIHEASEIGYLEPDDEKVCVLTPSAYTGSGYFTGIYDLASIKEYGAALPGYPSESNHHHRASVV